MYPQNLHKIRTSFSRQADRFETSDMSFSKESYLRHIVELLPLQPSDSILEVASGTCVCARALAPYVAQVTCLDATAEMLEIGRAEAARQGLSNLSFLEGYAEQLPFADESFDLVITRLSFHHFTSVELPFREMHRVLKRDGKLVIIDMEAAEEALRAREDQIETLRDFSHVKNLSKEEFLALYARHNCELLYSESTAIPVSLTAWMALTQTPVSVQKEIRRLMEEELAGQAKTGFFPYLIENEIRFDQRWLLLIGQKQG